MRQAILITAYHDMPQLERLVGYFDDDFDIFIHIDRRCHEAVPGSLLSSHRHLYNRYRVHWGSTRHLDAILFLMRKALQLPEVSYFHLITGSDYPKPTLDAFKAFCSTHEHDNYFEYFPLPRTGWDNNGGLDRIRYRWLQPWLRPSARHTLGYRINTLQVKLQRKLGLCRSFDYFDNHIYGGGTYWSLSRQAVEYLVQYLDQHPDYLRRFRHTAIAEEICLPTLLAHSGLPIINNSLRFIDWGSDGHHPAILTDRHFDAIMQSDALFCRKMQTGISDSLIQSLATHADT